MPGWKELVLAMLALGERLANTSFRFRFFSQVCEPLVITLVRAGARSIPDKSLATRPALAEHETRATGIEPTIEKASVLTPD
jgi:hypothetical protein